MVFFVELLTGATNLMEIHAVDIFSISELCVCFLAQEIDLSLNFHKCFYLFLSCFSPRIY